MTLHRMLEADREIALQGRSFAELQQWIHDIRTPLSIISMGVDALDRARHDDGQFVELSQMIVNEGIKPLNDLLDALGKPDASRSS
jgi:signal transduction histidine kinase